MQNQFLRKCFRCVNHPLAKVRTIIIMSCNGDAILTLNKMIKLQFSNTCSHAIHYWIPDNRFSEVFQAVWVVDVFLAKNLFSFSFYTTCNNRIRNAFMCKTCVGHWNNLTMRTEVRIFSFLYNHCKPILSREFFRTSNL